MHISRGLRASIRLPGHARRRYHGGGLGSWQCSKPQANTMIPAWSEEESPLINSVCSLGTVSNTDTHTHQMAAICLVVANKNLPQHQHWRKTNAAIED